MRQAGVTQEELENLKKSKNTSDKLVILENQAMSLVEEDVPVDPNKKLKALTMLADDNFIYSKAEIMNNIIKTEQMIMARTGAEVQRANYRLQTATIVLFLLVGVLIWLITRLGRALNDIIGCSIYELENTITQLGNGDFLTPIAVEPKNSESVLGWLYSTRTSFS